MPVLAEQAAEQRHEGDADEGDTAACHELLHTLGLRTGVIVAVTFEQIDCAPDTEASAQRDNEGLKNVNSRVKEIHKCVCRNMRDIELEIDSHNASAGTKTAVRLPIPASPFNV